MSTVEKADVSMFEDIHNVLRQFNNPAITRDDWKNLFTYSWKNGSSSPGFVLVNRGAIVGFLGTIFSDRVVGNKVERFCNASSWIVLPEFRNESALLVLAFARIRKHTLTNLSPNPIAAEVFTGLGFKTLNSHVRLAFPFPVLNRPSDLFLSFDKTAMADTLSQEDLRLHRDHSVYKCGQLLLQAGKGGYCYVVFTRVKRNRVAWTHIHHISNLRLFGENNRRIVNALCRRYRTAGVMIDDRFGNTLTLPFSFRYSLPQPSLYKSAGLPPSCVDNLYSELILLNI